MPITTPPCSWMPQCMGMHNDGNVEAQAHCLHAPVTHSFLPSSFILSPLPSIPTWGCRLRANPKSAMRRSASGEERESSRFWGLRSRCSGGVKRGLGRGWSQLTRLPHLPSRAVGWQHPRRTDSGRGGPFHAQPARQWQHLEPSKHPHPGLALTWTRWCAHISRSPAASWRRKWRAVASGNTLPWRRNWDRSPPAQNSITRYSRLRVCLEVGIRGGEGLGLMQA